ncbi:hypothetical protein QQF64_004959 [Cirrhinus molitorella]|uniref:Uncharacterized protein n=2 Tax=Cirrhinus molitorella TaxID=172907 RepID=A0ABR3MHR5_9TELE|nr:hypothetical protein Q8A67_020367 [Cirrhinus molitorella]
MKQTQGLRKARVISRAWPKGGITILSILYREPTKINGNIEVDSIPKDLRETALNCTHIQNQRKSNQTWRILL